MKRLSVDDQFFSELNLLNCYWAGMLAADGYIHKNRNEIKLKLHIKDKSHLHRFVSDVSYGGNVRIDSSCGNPYVSLSSKQWKTDLKENFGVIPTKSLILEPPPISNKEMMYSYIVGYIDGDGSIMLDRGLPRLAVYGTESVLRWISNLFNEDFPRENRRYNLTIPRKDSRSEMWYYRTSGERCERIIKYLSSFNVPHLNRKWSKIT